MKKVLAALAVASAASVGLVACGAGDRDMKPPTAQQRANLSTTTVPPVSPSDAAGTATEDLLQLQSPAFTAGAGIPTQYTCTGGSVSPPLQWANLPAGVTELALVVRDPDAAGFVHWVVSGLSPAAGGLGDGQTPFGAIQALNQTGSFGWFGPCPPAGTGTHTYQFRLYALSASPGVANGQDAVAAAQLIESAPVLATATLTGTATAPAS